MISEPQQEHQWLQQLHGTWEFTHDMGPDNPASGVVESRFHGGLWLLLETTGDSKLHGPWTSTMTLGFDPKSDAFVGTFVASMMTHLWIYRGTLNESRTILTLDAMGPKYSGEGLAQYQDIIEILSPDEWILRSQICQDDGSWLQFMEVSNKRRTQSA